MSDWIEHNGGPQPVGDDVWVEVLYPGAAEMRVRRAGDRMSLVWKNHKFKWSILNQHLIDAARLEGIRLGLEAAAKSALLHSHSEPFDLKYIDAVWSSIRDLNPDTIAREAQDMGSGKETT
ncbi:MAG: hypothetical protein ACK5X3_02105 [Pseudomonadota bacterium]